jgi:hypothetical protein
MKQRCLMDKQTTPRADASLSFSLRLISSTVESVDSGRVN